jgi:hypothetical protein
MNSYASIQKMRSESLPCTHHPPRPNYPYAEQHEAEKQQEQI